MPVLYIYTIISLISSNIYAKPLRGLLNLLKLNQSRNCLTQLIVNLYAMIPQADRL